MKYQNLSTRQNLAMTWWNRPSFKDYDGIICDGSVRSGKTVAMTVGFVMWAMSRFENQIFALCGKTIESLRRNVTNHLAEWLSGVFSFREHRSENKITVSAHGKTNVFYLFGGRDESSAGLIQGITLAGILLDEVVLMPRSFVEQAVARCSVTGSKLWFNCNPGGPSHWFYVNWIQRCAEMNMLHLHFTMDDNYSLTESIKERYKKLYTGVFYDRFIRGLWVVAEGLVYPMFDKDKHLTKDIDGFGEYYISIDYGTINPTAMGLWRVHKQSAVMVKEYYHNSREKQRQKTDEEYYADLVAFAAGYKIKRIIIDPSAASFKELIRRKGVFTVMDAKNDVIDGIRFTGTLLNKCQLLIHDSCKNTIREFGEYRWDEKAETDKVIKENDHSMDQMRYLCYTLRKQLGVQSDYQSLWML